MPHSAGEASFFGESERVGEGGGLFGDVGQVLGQRLPLRFRGQGAVGLRLRVRVEHHGRNLRQNQNTRCAMLIHGRSSTINLHSFFAEPEWSQDGLKN